MAGKRWTEEEYAFMREHYLSMTNKEMGRVLGRNIGSVGKQLRSLGIRRPPNVLREQAMKGRQHVVRVERWRWRTGQEQKTNLRFSSETTKTYLRRKRWWLYVMRKRGYIYFCDNPNVIYFDNNTNRSMTVESHTKNYGITEIIELNSYNYEAQKFIRDIRSPRP